MDRCRLGKDLGTRKAEAENQEEAVAAVEDVYVYYRRDKENPISVNRPLPLLHLFSLPFIR